MSKTITDAFPIHRIGRVNVNMTLLSDSRNYYHYNRRSVKYIVMHYTGNSSDTAKANANYFHNGSRGASAHYFVDDNACYQSVGLNNAAWAVGGTSSYKNADCRNKNSISVEMCCSGNYTVSNKTEENAAQLCALLCQYIGITADEVDRYVLRHWDVWAKNCPSGWTGKHNGLWNGFKNRVKTILNGESGDLTMTQYEELKAELAAMKLELAERTGYYNYIDSNMPQSCKPTIQKLVGNGYLKGNERGELMLTMDMMRILTILDRAGVLG